MQPFEKLKDRLKDSLEKIEISLETKLENGENIVCDKITFEHSPL